MIRIVQSLEITRAPIARRPLASAQHAMLILMKPTAISKWLRAASRSNAPTTCPPLEVACSLTPSALLGKAIPSDVCDLHAYAVFSCSLVCSRMSLVRSQPKQSAIQSWIITALSPMMTTVLPTTSHFWLSMATSITIKVSRLTIFVRSIQCFIVDFPSRHDNLQSR